MGNTHTLRDLSIDFVSLVARGADQDAHIVLAKAHEPEPTTNPAAPTRALPTGKEAPVAELNENVAKALGEDHGFELTDEQIAGLNALATEPGAAADPDPTDGDPTLTTADPQPGPAGDGDPVAKAIEPLQKQLDETREELAKERETREVTAAIDAARVAYAGLTVDPEELGPAIYRLGKGTGTEDDSKLLTSTLAAASEQNAVAQISEPIGFDGEAPTGSPAATVEALAKGIQDADPTVTTLAARVAAARSPQGIAAYEAAAAE